MAKFIIIMWFAYASYQQCLENMPNCCSGTVGMERCTVIVPKLQVRLALLVVLLVVLYWWCVVRLRCHEGGRRTNDWSENLTRLRRRALARSLGGLEYNHMLYQ